MRDFTIDTGKVLASFLFVGLLLFLPHHILTFCSESLLYLMFLARRLTRTTLGLHTRNPLVSGIRHFSPLVDDPSVSYAEATARGEQMSQSSGSSGGIPVEVRSVYMARGIDIKRVINNKDLYSGCAQHYDDKSLTITLDQERNEYITVFNYGSVVLFNVPIAMETHHLEGIKRHAVVTPLSHLEVSDLNTDSYRLMIYPELVGLPSVVKANHLNIKTLDMNNITIVATVMSQTVSLDYYANDVDQMLEKFMQMNLKVETNTKNAIRDLDKQQLYRLVASNNTVITNVLSKLGIFEGSDAAWENSDYHYTWEALRAEFELDYRFKDLSLKLDLIKNNARFYLDLLNAEKSEKLEWIIIVLIATEIILGLMGLYIEHYEKKLLLQKEDERIQLQRIDMMSRRVADAHEAKSSSSSSGSSGGAALA